MKIGVLHPTQTYVQDLSLVSRFFAFSDYIDITGIKTMLCCELSKIVTFVKSVA